MTDDLDRDLDKIAADIPHETSGFAELRRLLGLLPSPLSPLIPGAGAAQLADPGVGDASTGMSTPVSDVMSGAAPGSQPSWDQALASGAITDAFTNLGIGQKGFGSAVIRYLLTGIYNSDFALLPRDPASSVGAANPLPFWTFVQRSGTSINAKSVPDATLASGYKIAFEMSGINGSAGDDAYIEQIIPIVGGLSQVFAGIPVATFLNGTVVSGAQHYIEGQYLAADGVTTVGTAGSFVIQTNSPSFNGGVAGSHADLWLRPGGGTGIPSGTWIGLPVPGATAEFLRIRLGLRRGTAAVTQAQTTYVTDAHLDIGRDFGYFVDRSSGINGVTEQSFSQGQFTTTVGQGNAGGTTPLSMGLTEPAVPGGTGALGFSPSVDVTGVLSIAGTKPVVNVFTGSGTWNKPTNVQFIVVELVGGGGGGGGAPAVNTVGNGLVGSGGGAGGYARKVFTAADLASLTSAAVTVGALGAGASGALGGNGTASSFAGTGIGTVTGNGGTGAAVSIGASAIPTGDTGNGAGGTASGGDINIAGQVGTRGWMMASRQSGGVGGASQLGPGGDGFSASTTAATSGAGSAPASGYGGGGGGAAGAGTSNLARAGGNGAAGVVIVTEFYGP